MRNWLRAEGIEALRGACDGGNRRDRMNADVPPHPGVLRKRLQAIDLMGVDFFGRAKRLQEYDGEGVSLAGGWGGRVSCRGNMREVIISVYRLSSTFLGGYKYKLLKRLPRFRRTKSQKPHL
jgi:hypothetical protein